MGEPDRTVWLLLPYGTDIPIALTVERLRGFLIGIEFANIAKEKTYHEESNAVQ